MASPRKPSALFDKEKSDDWAEVNHLAKANVKKVTPFIV
jgi:hypothetical protein